MGQEHVSDMLMLEAPPPTVENTVGQTEHVPSVEHESTSSSPPVESIAPKPRAVDVRGQDSRSSSSVPSVFGSTSDNAKKVHSITPEACDRLAKISRVTHPLEEAQRRWETAAEVA